MLYKLKEEKKVVGTKQAKRALDSDEIKLLYVAKDAEVFVVNELIELCKQKNIEIFYVDTMRELGKACGIDVSAAVVAILK